MRRRFFLKASVALLSLALALPALANFPFPAFSPTRTPAVVNYATLLTSTVDSTGHTFASVNLPSPSSDRYVFVSISWRSTATNTTISSVTLAGNLMTRAIRGTSSAANSNVEIFYINDESNTSGDIVITHANSINRLIAKVAFASGLSGSSPVSTSAVQGTGGLTLSTTGPALAFEAQALASAATYARWVQGGFDLDGFTDLGSGSNSLMGSYATRFYDRTGVTVNGGTDQNSVAEWKVGLLWALPAFTPTICDVFDDFSDATDQATVTTASLKIGEQVDGRMVVCTFGWEAAASRTITTVTIGGATATVQSNATSTGGVGIAYATGVTGTTAAVVITFSNTVTRCGGTILRTTPASATANNTQNNSGGVATLTVSSLQVKNGGFTVYAVRNSQFTDKIAIAWGGTDMPQNDHHLRVESPFTFRTGFLKNTADETANLTFTTSAGNAKNAVAVSWL